HADIRIEGLGDGVMLAGMVANAGEAQQAHDLATRLVGDASKVVNGLTIQGRDQVMLKVTVAEMQRDVIKQLGIDLTGRVSYGAASVNFNTENPFSINGKAVNNTFGVLNLNNQVTATLRAMER